MANKPRGRHRKYAEYENLLSELPSKMDKRPKYINGIGIFRGARGDTVWIKVRLSHATTYNGKVRPAGSSAEIKLGKLSSWSWAQLETKLAEMQGLADRNEPLEDQVDLTFSDWSSDWLIRAKTRVRDFMSLSIHVNKHLLPTFGARPLKSITSNNINHWISSQLVSLAPATVKRQMNTFKAILNDAVKSGHIEKNPCSNADPIRGIVGRQRFLSTEELIKLLKAANDIDGWLEDFIVWCLHSGMRKGEIQALLWEDVHKLEGGLALINIKTSKAGTPRYVNCTQGMIKILERQKKRKVEADDRVFPISAMTLRRRWEAVREKVGLMDVTIHDLRRTHSTYAAKAGVDLNTLAGRLGHSDLGMLQKHYAVFVGSAAADAANTIQETFDNLFGAANGKET